MTAQSKLLSVSEAAEFLGVSQITIRRQIYSKKLPHHKIGDRYLFSEQDLSAFLEQCRVPSLTERQNEAMAARSHLRAVVQGAGNE